MKSAEAAAIAAASRNLLSQGDAEGAERVLSPIFGKFRADAPTLHLMGLIKKAQNQLEEAERHFRSAIAQALSESAYYNDLGVVLQERGSYDEAARVLRAALALAPHVATVRANLVRCFLAAGDFTQAEREARAYVASEPSPESWSLLAQVQRAQDRFEDALTSTEAALKCAPKLRGLQYSYGVALERVGRGGEALVIYERLAEQDLDTPELAHHLVRALYQAGRKQDAEKVAEQAVQMWAGSAALHAALARIRWLRGEGEKCTAFAEEELLWRRPSDLALRLTCADVLHRGGHHQKALLALEEALRFSPDSPGLLSAMGVILDELERPLDALKVLQRVLDMAPQSRSARRNMLSTLLRAGRPEDALKIARDLRVEEPDEQYLIACEAMALRVLQAPEYRAICDFDRMVRTYDIQPPRNHLTIESLNAALSDVLRMQHRTNAPILDQTLPNGSQTQRNLLSIEDPQIKAFLASVESAVRDYVGRLTPQTGEVGRRRTNQHRYANLWSVRLGQNGFAPSHVHDRGWISGVYVTANLPAERQKDAHAGWVKLGEPNRPPAGCGPEHWVEPKPGRLVLFPSYFWQGVQPVEGAERLSLGVTIVPH